MLAEITAEADICQARSIRPVQLSTDMVASIRAVVVDKHNLLKTFTQYCEKAFYKGAYCQFSPIDGDDNADM
jgi:hypothetical protein